MAEAEKNTDDTAVLEAPVDEVEATDAVESGENTSEGGDEPILDVDATADRLTEIANQSLDSNEVARQIEELTAVVLDAAEVSTRSASIAADVSSAMRMVVAKIEETNRRNVLHSRVMLGAICVSLLVAMGFFCQAANRYTGVCADRAATRPALNASEIRVVARCPQAGAFLGCGGPLERLATVVVGNFLHCFSLLFHAIG